MSWFMDRALSRRLERAEGVVGTTFAETNQRVVPERGSTWRDFAGTHASRYSPVQARFLRAAISERNHCC